jgi:hypothetical protein
MISEPVSLSRYLRNPGSTCLWSTSHADLGAEVGLGVHPFGGKSWFTGVARGWCSCSAAANCPSNKTLAEYIVPAYLSRRGDRSGCTRHCNQAVATIEAGVLPYCKIQIAGLRAELIVYSFCFGASGTDPLVYHWQRVVANVAASGPRIRLNITKTSPMKA